MVSASVATRRPFRDAIEKWRHVPGGIDHDTGEAVEKPRELERAEILDGLAEKFHKDYDELLEKDGMRIFHTLTILNWAKGPMNVAGNLGPPVSLANPGVIDVPDWLVSDEPVEEAKV